MSDQDGTFATLQPLDAANIQAAPGAGDPWADILGTSTEPTAVVRQITDHFRELERENDRLVYRAKVLVQTVDAISRERDAMAAHIQALQALCDIQRTALADAEAILAVRRKKPVLRWPW
jgi:hypothetical protein